MAKMNLGVEELRQELTGIRSKKEQALMTKRAAEQAVQKADYAIAVLTGAEQYALGLLQRAEKIATVQKIVETPTAGVKQNRRGRRRAKAIARKVRKPRIVREKPTNEIAPADLEHGADSRADLEDQAG